MKTSNKLRYSFLRIVTGSELSSRKIPLMSMVADQPGPIVWLTACIHGDEVGGTVTIHELFKRLRKRLLRGSVYSFPLANPFGFENISRNISVSREDLNRAFPGNPAGSLAERLAYQIFNHIEKSSPDLIIDLHNDWRKSVPYAVLDTPAKLSVSEYEHLNFCAHSSRLPVVLETDTIKGTLSYSMLQSGISALTLELGESYVVNEKNVQLGTDAIWHILAAMDMVEDTEPTTEADYLIATKGKDLRYSQRPLSSKSGIIRFLKKPGSFVIKNEPIARIYNSFGRLQETLLALDDGFVLGHTDASLSFPGFPVMAFGLLP
ncbi:MAG: succinylglutamate desuccinylase/aspartoacylase family protein [Cyclobacteriaceae bacterium]|nr:succinylglutamate desuccinylase/aspartoacylase family protein [Cyclobacteriaceae bacterium]